MEPWVATDDAGNGNLPVPEFVILYDSTPPVVAFESDNVSPTNQNLRVTGTCNRAVCGTTGCFMRTYRAPSHMHPHTATFSEPVWTFGVDDISLATGGEVVNLVPLSPPHTRFAFEVAGALDGPQGLRVRPATVSDAAGNGNVGSQWFGGHIIYDTAPPRPTITSASPHLSNRNFTVTGTAAQLSSHPLQPRFPSSHPHSPDTSQ